MWMAVSQDVEFGESNIFQPLHERMKAFRELEPLLTKFMYKGPN